MVVDLPSKNGWMFHRWNNVRNRTFRWILTAWSPKASFRRSARFVCCGSASKRNAGAGGGPKSWNPKMDQWMVSKVFSGKIRWKMDEIYEITIRQNGKCPWNSPKTWKILRFSVAHFGRDVKLMSPSYIHFQYSCYSWCRDYQNQGGHPPHSGDAQWWWGKTPKCHIFSPLSPGKRS